MKNKKAEQQKRRNELKAQRRQAKSLDRGAPSIIEKPTILIVCEGQNTEPSYFNNFKLSSATVKSIGEGYNTVSLVERAIILSQRKVYDQVWCVFDKDDFDDADFNSAINLANQNNFGVAYSNQAFEYWIILHFNDHQGGGITRDLYDKLINKSLKPFGLKYDGKKSKIISDEIFDILESIERKSGKTRRNLAIDRAKRNYQLLTHQNPAKEESSTTVYKLVEELDKYR
jgi:hypothetical protein